MATVLIVEDNLTFRHSLRDMLRERFGPMQFQEASDGLEARRFVKDGPPDLIFMDIRLSGDNGLEITREIKREHPLLPIIILADHDLAEYREAAYRYGADFFVAKGSSSWEEIIAFVESVLSSQAATAQRVENGDS